MSVNVISAKSFRNTANVLCRPALVVGLVVSAFLIGFAYPPALTTSVLATAKPGNSNSGKGGGNPPGGTINQTLEPYTISLIAKEYLAEEDISIWHYRVTSPEGGPAVKDISHWNLALCHTESKTCESQTDDADHIVDEETDPTPWDVNCDPSLSEQNRFWGIKWDIEFDADDGDDTKHFYLYLEGNWQQGEVEAAIKAGQNEYYGLVQGPLCQPVDEELEAGNLGDLVIVQNNPVGNEVALTDLGAGDCEMCAPFSSDLVVSFVSSCTNYEVEAYYSVEEATGSSPGGAGTAISSEFDHPILKIDKNNSGTYSQLGFKSTNAVSLSGFSSDNCVDANSTSVKRCASFPVAVDLSRIGNMSSGWKFDFTIHVELNCLD